MRKKGFYKLASAALCLSLCLGNISMPVFAAEGAEVSSDENGDGAGSTDNNTESGSTEGGSTDSGNTDSGSGSSESGSGDSASGSGEQSGSSGNSESGDGQSTGDNCGSDSTDGNSGNTDGADGTDGGSSSGGSGDGDDVSGGSTDNENNVDSDTDSNAGSTDVEAAGDTGTADGGDTQTGESTVDSNPGTVSVSDGNTVDTANQQNTIIYTEDTQQDTDGEQPGTVDITDSAVPAAETPTAAPDVEQGEETYELDDDAKTSLDSYFDAYLSGSEGDELSGYVSEDVMADLDDYLDDYLNDELDDSIYENLSAETKTVFDYLYSKYAAYAEANGLGGNYEAELAEATMPDDVTVTENKDGTTTRTITVYVFLNDQKHNYDVQVDMTGGTTNGESSSSTTETAKYYTLGKITLTLNGDDNPKGWKNQTTVGGDNKNGVERAADYKELIEKALSSLGNDYAEGAKGTDYNAKWAKAVLETYAKVYSNADLNVWATLHADSGADPFGVTSRAYHLDLGDWGLISSIMKEERDKLSITKVDTADKSAITESETSFMIWYNKETAGSDGTVSSIPMYLTYDEEEGRYEFTVDVTSVTTANGTLDLDYVLDKAINYYLKEATAPEGYDIDTNVYVIMDEAKYNELKESGELNTLAEAAKAGAKSENIESVTFLAEASGNITFGNTKTQSQVEPVNPNPNDPANPDTVDTEDPNDPEEPDGTTTDDTTIDGTTDDITTDDPTDPTPASDTTERSGSSGGSGGGGGGGSSSGGTGIHAYSSSATTLSDTATPLTELPDEATPTTELPDEDTPTTDIPDEGTPTTDIPDGDVPMANVPQTGDSMMLYSFMAFASGAALMWLALSGRKREDEDAA